MAKEIKFGFYHVTDAKPKKLTVLKENADKTVDLGEGDVLVVGKCPVASEPKHGHFTFGELPKEAAKPEKTETPTE